MFTRLPVYRAGEELREVILISPILGLKVHYAGKAALCPGPECTICKKLRAQTRWYMIISTDGSGSHALLELGEHTMDVWRRDGGLVNTGTILAIQKKKKKYIEVRTVGQVIELGREADDQDVLRVVANLFQLSPPRAIETTLEAWITEIHEQLIVKIRDLKEQTSWLGD